MLLLGPSLSQAVLLPPDKKCQPDLTEPVYLGRNWPVKEHHQRHLQVQQAVVSGAEEIRQCQWKFGILRYPIVVYVSSEGEFAVDTNPQDEAGKCYAWALRRQKAGAYMCTFSYPYLWTGLLPEGGY